LDRAGGLIFLRYQNLANKNLQFAPQLAVASSFDRQTAMAKYEHSTGIVAALPSFLLVSGHGLLSFWEGNSSRCGFSETGSPKLQA
jgi:hypothetical protein